MLSIADQKAYAQEEEMTDKMKKQPMEMEREYL